MGIERTVLLLNILHHQWVYDIYPNLPVSYPPLILSFNKNILGAYNMPGTVLGSADASVSKPVKDICPYRASIRVEKLDNQ